MKRFPWKSATSRGRTYGYGNVPWVTRPVVRWLDLALSMAERADGRPAHLFAALEDRFKDTIKWEAQVPFVVAIACLALCRYHPLAALQLSIEWGHDTDSYAQIVGAFAGAIHGASIFPAPLRTAVTERLRADYRVRLADEVDLLVRLNRRHRDPIEADEK